MGGGGWADTIDAIVLLLWSTLWTCMSVYTCVKGPGTKAFIVSGTLLEKVSPLVKT